MKIARLLTILLLLSAPVFAQQKADSSNKAAIPVPEDFRDDWANLRHYEAENKTLGNPAPGEKRVVFLGSSVFEFWRTRLPEYFAAHKNYIDRGISGQIAPQLLLRFQQDVIALKPKAVIILAGSNDIAGTTGHVTNERILNDIKSMVELCQVHKITPILCAYVPINEYPWRKGLEPAEKIISLNKAITAYAAQNKLILLDYYTPLVDDKKGTRPDLTLDGVHPNAAGYRIMAKVTDEAIAKALKQK
ncbi:GDSL-type esterase/lipase family protein [Mucilaginibacter sp. AK015]|uniref:GDSL-type esterase/lipase family protein n=1 Tax=Mucilaginibacter sp. AK015 TaxID=2723072 RepID=UPI0016228F79|nr:GDSL-type esterase/lipase family protein [Mucilaginibacter sp. AK015]MBB5397219.1 lysophospholipase L1-like esterase [Mucilaginibacter sp. AK015]